MNGDGTPDITLDGSNFPPDDALGKTWGLLVESDNNTIDGVALQNFPYFGIAVGSGYEIDNVNGNRITNNTVDGGGFGVYGISVGAGSLVRAGTTQDTTVSGNTVSGTTFTGIYVGTVGTGSSNTNTTIQQNTFFENSTGIATFPYLAATTRPTNLHILDNHVYANGLGINAMGGACGATGNTVEAEIAHNTLSGNGTGINTNGGTNHGCPGGLSPTSQNHLTVTITDNVSEDERGTGISIFGGTVDANNNTVAATVTGNTVLRSGAFGISVSGGSANYLDASGMEVSTAVANANTVTATLANNRVEGAMYPELLFVAGWSGGKQATIWSMSLSRTTSCVETAAVSGDEGA